MKENICSSYKNGITIWYYCVEYKEILISIFFFERHLSILQLHSYGKQADKKRVKFYMNNSDRIGLINFILVIFHSKIKMVLSKSYLNQIVTFLSEIL